jgi:hypothetical protein
MGQENLGTGLEAVGESERDPWGQESLWTRPDAVEGGRDPWGRRAWDRTRRGSRESGWDPWGRRAWGPD